MKYAIGEILLVMIGILLALQVTNWNEENKQNLKKQKLISNLINDFKENETQLNIAIDQNVSLLENMDLFFEKAYEPTLTVSIDSLKSLMVSFFISVPFAPSIGSFEEAKANGHLSLINDKSINNSIVDFLLNYDNYLLLTERNLTSFYQGSTWELKKSIGPISKLIGGYISNNFILKDVDEASYLELINSNLVIAAIENQYILTSSIHRKLKQMDVASKKIIENLSRLEK